MDAKWGKGGGVNWEIDIGNQKLHPVCVGCNGNRKLILMHIHYHV